MNIQTKFNVGNEIFTVDNKTLKIKKIKVEKLYVCTTEHDTTISYKGEGESVYEDAHNESVCFATAEELVSYIKGE